jgi:T4 RnlA family RNA ligase
MKLVEEGKNEKRPTFVFKDVACTDNDNVIYRIFNYQLPKYSDFLRDGALSCRGSMFRINTETNEVTLASLPMDKFFGYGENPSTMKIKFEDIKEAYLKVDGSLLSTYLRTEKSLGLKSKSEPVFAYDDLVQKFLNDNLKLKNELLKLAQEHYTVDFEFVSPENRVILEYKDVNMHILNIRNNLTGEYVDFRNDSFISQYPDIEPFLVESMELEVFRNLDNKNKLLALANIEGAVIRLADGRLVKIKTEWYMSQHNYVNIQDFSKAGEKLFMIVMNESVDELRSLLHYRNRSPNFKLEEKLALIEKTEEEIQRQYGLFVEEVGTFIDSNKHLDKNDFARLANTTLPKFLMNPTMSLYNGSIKSLRDAFIHTYQKKIKVKI